MVADQSFQFCGTLSASKSELNRLLIVQSFAPQLQVLGGSACDDVRYMREALKVVLQGGDISLDAGSAGTTFRFLALRLSRVSGRHLLRGSESLLKRPQAEIIAVLSQLGVKAWLVKEGGRLTGMIIEGNGWIQPKNPLKIDGRESSQFASAVLLAAWGLPFDLIIERSTERSIATGPSQGYFDMTIGTLKNAGMQIHMTSQSFLTVLAGSRVTASSIKAEVDVSSAFAVAALGVVGGKATIKNFPARSMQPDQVFVSILQKMGVDIQLDGEVLIVNRTANLAGIDQDLCGAPDLFPLLAVLCSLAKSPSRLFGAKHLIHKESNRLRETAALLTCVGARFDLHDDGMTIHGGLIPIPLKDAHPFDPAQDHRMAMAAALLNLAGANLKILTPEVVDKSFPEFWDLFS